MSSLASDRNEQVKWLATQGVCVQPPQFGEVVGLPCPGCSHANYVHYGFDACMVCELRFMIRELWKLQEEMGKS